MRSGKQLIDLQKLEKGTDLTLTFPSKSTRRIEFLGFYLGQGGLVILYGLNKDLTEENSFSFDARMSFIINDLHNPVTISVGHIGKKYIVSPSITPAIDYYPENHHG